MGMALARGTLRGRALLTGSLAVALVAGSGAPLLAGTARAQATVSTFSTLAAAPDDAVAYFNIPLDERSAQWTQAQDLIERAGFGDALAQAQAEMGAEDLPLDAFLGGEAGVIVTGDAVENAIEAGNEAADDELMGGFDAAAATDDAAASPTEPQGWAVALDARAPDTAFAGMTAAVEGQADDAGTTASETDYAGVTITSAPPVPGENDDNDMGLAVARVDDLVLIASVPADLEPLIDAAQGTTATLADVEEFSEVEAALPGEFLVFGFVNSVEATAAQGGATFGEDMGLPDLTAIQPPSMFGLTIAADPAGFRMETVTVGAGGADLPAGQPNFESDLVGKAPEDALFFLGASNLAATKVLDTVGAFGIAVAFGAMGGGSDAAGTPAADQPLDAWVAAQYETLAGMLGFNLQTDLFQQLTGEWGLWLRGADPSTLAALFASGVTDADTVAGALDQINLLAQGAGGGESFVTTRTVGDGSVSTIELGPGAPAFEYGAVAGELLVGVGDAIDVHTSGSGDGLGGNAQYQEVMATLPAEHNSTFYVDLGQAIPLVQALSESSNDTGSGPSDISDADPSCANYATAEEAQAAYDNFEAGTENLDADFDGQVCEDFFAPAALDDGDSGGDAADAFASFDASALRAFASVGYEEDGMQRSSSILYIAE